jgi:hypothetical protein
VSGPSRSIELRYQAGAATAVQTVEMWLPLRWLAVSWHTLSVWSRSQYAGYIFVTAFFATVVFGSIGAPTWLQRTAIVIVVAGMGLIVLRTLAALSRGGGSRFRRWAVFAFAFIVLMSLLRGLAGW